jgi:zinc-ribbon domain
MTDTVYCTECGARTSPAAKFCSECGAEQLPSDTTASDAGYAREMPATGDRPGRPVVKTSTTTAPPPAPAPAPAPAPSSMTQAATARQTPPPSSTAQRATVRQTPPSKAGGAAPGSGSSGAVTLIAIPFILIGALVSGLWRLAGVLVVCAVIAGFIWGGTTEAHARCFAHELGAPGLLNAIACVVEH